MYERRQHSSASTPINYCSPPIQGIPLSNVTDCIHFKTMKLLSSLLSSSLLFLPSFIISLRSYDLPFSLKTVNNISANMKYCTHNQYSFSTIASKSQHNELIPPASLLSLGFGNQAILIQYPSTTHLPLPLITKKPSS